WVGPAAPRLVHLVGERLDARKERLRPCRVEGRLQPHCGFAETGQHPLERLLGTDGGRADDELRADSVLLRPAPHAFRRLAPSGCERPVAVTESRIVPSRLRVTEQVEALHTTTIRVVGISGSRGRTWAPERAAGLELTLALHERHRYRAIAPPFVVTRKAGRDDRGSLT